MDGRVYACIKSFFANVLTTHTGFSCFFFFLFKKNDKQRYIAILQVNTASVCVCECVCARVSCNMLLSLYVFFSSAFRSTDFSFETSIYNLQFFIWWNLCSIYFFHISLISIKFRCVNLLMRVFECVWVCVFVNVQASLLFRLNRH